MEEAVTAGCVKAHAVTRLLCQGSGSHQIAVPRLRQSPDCCAKAQAVSHQLAVPCLRQSSDCCAKAQAVSHRLAVPWLRQSPDCCAKAQAASHQLAVPQQMQLVDGWLCYGRGCYGWPCHGSGSVLLQSTLTH